MTADSTIDYEALAQNAMRGVVRAVLERTAKSGLPGEHHFFISFDTQAPGVVLSKRLREKFPEEMTIVLQHRFWDLAVAETQFEVKLTFDGIPERLVVPFAAINVFFDPSVRYALQFEDIDFTSEDEIAAARPGLTEGADDPAPGPAAVPAAAPQPVPERRLAPVAPAASGPQPVSAETSDRAGDSDAGMPAGSEADRPDDSETGEDADAKPASGAVVVNLDAFRKR